MERAFGRKLEPSATHVREQLEVATLFALGVLLVRVGEHIPVDLEQMFISAYLKYERVRYQRCQVRAIERREILAQDGGRPMAKLSRRD